MATLKSLVDETTNIKNELVACHDNLSDILTSKNVSDLASDKLSDLVNKVKLLKPMDLYLYNEGDENSRITGNWSSGYKLGNGTFVKNSSYIELKALPWRGNGLAEVITVSTLEKIDFTNYRTLTMEIFLNKLHWVNLAVSSDRTSNPRNYPAGTSKGDVAVASITSDDGFAVNTTHKISLDVSSLEGFYYPIVCCYNAYHDCQFNLIKVWLE